MASLKKTSPRYAPSQIANAEHGSDFMSPDPKKAARMKAANAAADAAPAKAARKASPATSRKAAAVEAYTKEYGRAPQGRMSAATLERRVSHAQGQRARLDAMQEYYNRPASKPAAPASRPMSGELAMPSRMPSSEPTAGAKIAQHWNYAEGMHDPHGTNPGGRGLVTKGLLGVGVGAAAVQGYLSARDRGDSVGTSVAKGALNAAPQAFVAAAPQIAKGAGEFAEVAFEASSGIMRHAGDFTDMLLGWPIAKMGLAVGASGVVAKGVETVAKVAGKFALPASLAVGGVIGAMKDENRLRGAGRGMVSALDPTALFMKKGLAERGYNAVFGEQDRPIGQQPRMNQRNPATDDYRGKGGFTRHSEARLSAPPHFAAANEAFRAGRVKEAQKAEANGNHSRGFQNPQNLYAALRARNASTDNVANF